MRSLATAAKWGLMVLFVLSGWFLPFELDSLQSDARGGSVGSVPEYLMRNMRYVMVDGQTLKAQMHSTTAKFLLDQQFLDAESVESEFYNERGEITKVLGDFAVYDMRARVLRLRENVVCETPDQFFLRAPAATYDLSKRFFVAERDVSGNTQDLKLKFWSDRGESYVDTRTANLYGNARSEYLSAKQGITKIRGERALIDRGEEAITFFDRVKINQEKYDIESKVASLFYSKETKDLQYMVARDEVMVREASGRFAKSQEAQFFAPTNTIVLLGFPAVYDKDDVITGDRITLFKNTGVVEVTSANAAISDEKPVGTTPAAKKDKQNHDADNLSEEDEELVIEK